MGKLKESLPDDYFTKGYWTKTNKVEYLAKIKVTHPMLHEEIVSGRREYIDYDKWVYTGTEYVPENL